ncbi:hypothetical protein [Wenyingzhuangia sp. 2_MG-2023]|uniref:hypothetical protein n=1 Tax=Wenyingzhuangia sp. 2_MG-2023 TaxID=3062639 RepID=UPI0026E21F18|nr:hypothetical protein [Wenyingzhuangia sp. 2_MG-2023]MDO6736401.1 hypothetical protein [Wenyingzhuangia sp. 2_MG-2023]MDO6801288.1 hypothetical protein [Wenyingzhuangia sp. 1_MG-2023]
MKKKLFYIVCLLFSVDGLLAQEIEEKEEVKEKRHRVSVVLGHSYLNLGYELGNKDVLSIPSFGLDYEYWFKKKWGIGVFSDVELISSKESEELHGGVIDRRYPVVITLDALWNPVEHLEFVLGPGVIFENGEVKDLIRIGLEYDLNIGHHWDVAPSFFYDHATDGISNLSIGIGIGKSF